MFQATLKWRSEAGISTGPSLGDPPPGARFYPLVEAADVATRRISCEIRALYPEQLAAALDSALRSITVHATLTEAILETRAVRLEDPTVSNARLVQELARELWAAKVPVSFGPSWTPTPGADVSVGAAGLEDALEAFLEAHPAWQTARW